MTVPPFDSVMWTGEMLLQARPGEHWPDVFDTTCREARRIGITHVQVNILADPFHQILLEQPDNHYAWFAAYGPALDQFVSSSVNEGVYPLDLLARNLERLKQASQAAIRNDLSPVLMLCEPRFAPERLFDRHPDLRGPRIDNPRCSTTVWHAVCTDHPLAREHYRQMLTRLMQAVPQLAAISVFTNDSGAGFCHSQSLYAGANGPDACRAKPVGQRVAEFLGLLRETGATVNPDFRVSLCTGIEAEERTQFVASAGDGVTDEVQGRYSWIGGLEDQWEAHQQVYGADPEATEAAREQRFRQFRQRLEQVRSFAKAPIGICSMPTDGFYPPLVYVPHPFQNLEILAWLREMDVRDLNCKGDLSRPDLLACNVNHEAFAAFAADPSRSPQQIVSDIAAEAVGADHGAALSEAWRIVDRAHRRRPFWTHMFGYSLALMPGPLVPDPEGLPAEQIAYYDHRAYADYESIPNRHRLAALQMEQGQRQQMLDRYRQETHPPLSGAIELLRTEAERCERGNARELLHEQALHVEHFLLWQRSANNWCEAGAYLAPGDGRSLPAREMKQIVDDEIAVTEALAALLDGRLHRFLYTGEVEGLFYMKSPNFVEQLRRRAAAMHAHRNDAVCVLSIR